MKISGKHTITVVIGLVLLQSLYGQGEKNMVDYLKQKFISYTEAVPREEIFLHSDREEYIAGEDFWFNLYLIDRQSLKPSSDSRIAYLELLNSENRPVLQKKILLDKGFGPGQFVLSDTLSTGIYTIRAYTSWMKNFLPFNCFMKEIAIYNTLSSRANKGNLTAGSYIKEDINKNPVGKILNTPLILTFNNTRHDTLEINLISDNKFLSENSNLLYIFIQTHGNIDHISSEKITGEEKRIVIPKTTLNRGINQITIFNSKGEPVAEKYIYTPFEKKNLLTLHSAGSWGLRNEITLEIEPGNEISGSSGTNNLSISVAPVTDFQVVTGINDYLIFGTEYEGVPLLNSKGRKLDELPPELIDSLLLSVKSNWIDWTAILSEDESHFKYKIEKEDHFISGRLLSGVEQTPQSGKIVLMCMPGKEAGFQYARTDDEGDFSFNVHIDEAVKDLIIMPDDINKDYKIILESSFADQYPMSAHSVDSTQRPFPPQISKWSVNYQVMKIFGTTSHGNPLNQGLAPLNQIRFYGMPDIELIMSDYISLPTMEEVFFELIPRVSLKKKNSKYEISISDRVDNTPNITTPYILLDGVIIRDPAIIANLDPAIVEKIDVIKDNYIVGKYRFPSIINVLTTRGNFSCISLPDYMIRLPYKVVEPVWSFVSPDYSVAEKKASRIPDYRNTLYWNPAVKPGNDGKYRITFWSSDNKGDYMINIQVVNSDGELMSTRKYINME